MLFYEGTSDISESVYERFETSMGRRWREDDGSAMRLQHDTMQLWKEDAPTLPFVADVREDRIIIGIASQSRLSLAAVDTFLETVGIDHTNDRIHEVSTTAFTNMLRQAERRGYIDGDRDLIDLLQLDYISRRGNRNLDEEIITPEAEPADLVQAARNLLSVSLAEEIERILEVPNVKGIAGHPVHYILQGDNAEFQHDAKQLLMKALIAAGRVQSCRCTRVPGKHLDHVDLEALYFTAGGATVCLDFTGGVAEDEDEAYRTENSAENLEGCARKLQRYSRDVLGIVQFGRSCERYMSILTDQADQTTFVEIREDIVNGVQAADYLRRRAAGRGLEVNESLLDILAADMLYTPSDLNRIFNRWESDQMKTVIYPQYAHLVVAQKPAEPRGTGLKELDEMIGLDAAKQQIRSILDYFTAQKAFSDRGLSSYRPSMHMIFSGAPGTAKTTVARLVGQIFRENEILSEGHVIEVGRADMIGRYVGHTAPLVRRQFRRAAGNILFVDEAYSLLDDREGLYGDEALSTIVQEMENHRDDMFVILAGYTDKMERLLERNPGLRSRIAAHIRFDDYSASELFEITKLIARKMDMRLTDDTEEVLLPLYERVMREPDFGNGRYVRNMLEHARMAQATRLIREDSARITAEMVHTLRAEDFTKLPVGAKKKDYQMGFMS